MLSKTLSQKQKGFLKLFPPNTPLPFHKVETLFNLSLVLVLSIVLCLFIFRFLYLSSFVNIYIYVYLACQLSWIFCRKRPLIRQTSVFWSNPWTFQMDIDMVIGWYVTSYFCNNFLLFICKGSEIQFISYLLSLNVLEHSLNVWNLYCALPDVEIVPW